MSEQSRPSFYAVIPAEVRYANINANAKLLYGEVTALCNQEGYCWASNAYFAELYGVQARQISRWVAELVKQGFIKIELSKSQKGMLRKLLIINSVQTRQKRRGGIDKKDVGNNTSNNKDNINIIYSKSLKAKEISTLLADLISERNPSLSKKLSKDSNGWAVDIERLHRLDGQSWEDIEAVVRWCQADDFWQNNILSGSKLRKQWVTLFSKADLGAPDPENRGRLKVDHKSINWEEV